MNVTAGNHHTTYFPQAIPEDRRSSSRFPMAQDVTYQYRHGKIATGGAGRCVNIGSGGVLFTTSTRLPIGRTVEVSINWPALLDGSCPLKFIASGPVVRAEENRAAIRIDRYEFRTRGARAGLAAALNHVRAPLGPVALEARPR